MLQERRFPTERPELFKQLPALRAAPQFRSLAETCLLRSIASNLAAYGTRLPEPPVDRAFAPMFRSAYLRRRAPGQSLLASFLLHVGVVACLVNLPPLPRPIPQRGTVEALQRDYKIIWYQRDEQLPAVTPPKPVTPPPRRQRPAAAVEKHLASAAPVQVIISRPPQPDNQRQSIVQPQAPDLRISSHVEVPNLVQWTGVAIPPRPVTSELTRPLTQIDVPRLPPPVAAPPPAPVPPPPELRLAARAEAPAIAQQDSVVIPPQPVISEASKALAQIVVPRLPVPAPAPPQPPNLQGPHPNLAGVAVPTSTLPGAPKPPLPEPLLLNPPSSGLRNVIAVGIAPAAVPEQVMMPEGNRAGEFGVKSGNDKSAGDAEKGWGGDENGGKAEGLPELADRDLGGIRVPHLSITGPDNTPLPPESPAPVAVGPAEPRPAPPPPRGGDKTLANLIAKARRPALLPAPPVSAREPQDSFFGPRRVYTLSINMPNLSSGSGSWVLRFAELNGGGPDNGEISSPVAVRKVDPRYIPSAMREHVEGTVTLAAYILRDGTVSNIRVLSSLDPRLDSSAAAALADWQFTPARKNGLPVDLEVVVRIPFRLPSL